jgi:hypothetical protein
MAGVLAIALASSGCGDSSPTTTTPKTDAVASTTLDITGGVLSGRWSQPSTRLGEELSPLLVWTGSQVLILHPTAGGMEVTGERFDPATGTTTKFASSGLTWRTNPAVVWTGRELLVVGGSTSIELNTVGAAYNPATDAWRRLPDPPTNSAASIRGDAVWTGTEILVWTAGLAFNPDTNQWRTIARYPLTMPSAPVVVWAGTQLVVWGGCDSSIPQCDDFGEGMLTVGASYNPPTDEWRALPVGPLAAGVHPKAVWTGHDVVMYAGLVLAGSAGSSAAAYDPTTRKWRALADPPLSPRRYAAAVWTNRYFILWGGSGRGIGSFANGAAFDIESSRWLLLPEAPPSSGRDRHAAAWTGHLLYIDGGHATNGPLIFSPV